MAVENKAIIRRVASVVVVASILAGCAPGSELPEPTPFETPKPVPTPRLEPAPAVESTAPIGESRVSTAVTATSGASDEVNTGKSPEEGVWNICSPCNGEELMVPRSTSDLAICNFRNRPWRRVEYSDEPLEGGLAWSLRGYIARTSKIDQPDQSFALFERDEEHDNQCSSKEQEEGLFDTAVRFMEASGDMENPPRFSRNRQPMSFGILESSSSGIDGESNDFALAHGIFLGSLVIKGRDGNHYNVGVFGFEGTHSRTQNGRYLVPFIIGGYNESLGSLDLSLDNDGSLDTSIDRTRESIDVTDVESRLENMVGKPCVIRMPCERYSTEDLSDADEWTHFRFNHAAYNRSVVYGMKHDNAQFFGFTTYLDIPLLPYMSEVMFSSPNN